jgi:hypothetical protein
VSFPTGGAARHPSLPVLALPVGDQIKLIDLSPPDDVELGYRESMARFDPPWHREQAATHEKGASWYAAAFHWGQLAEHDPAKDQYWDKLEATCGRMGDWRPALAVCDRLVGRDPTQAPIYLRRARLRAPLLQFHEATADNLAGLALSARSQKR